MTSVLPKNISVADFRYSEPKPLDNGSKTVYVSHKGDRLFLQTPLMHLPYGVNNSADMEAKKNPGKPTGPPRYDLNVSFRDMERNPKVRSLYDKMLEIEASVIDAAFANRLSWFRNDFKGNRDFVVDKFQPIVKLDRDPETNEPLNRYPATMKAKLPYNADADTFSFECFDAEKAAVDFKRIKDRLKGGKAQLLIQLTGLWFAGGRFGCSWKVHKAKFEMPGGVTVDWEEDSEDPADMDAEDDAAEEARAQAALQQRAKKARTAAPVPPLLPDTDDEEEAAAADADMPGATEEEGEEEEAVGSDQDPEDDPTPPPRAATPPPKKAPAAKKAAAKK